MWVQPRADLASDSAFASGAHTISTQSAGKLAQNQMNCALNAFSNFLLVFVFSCQLPRTKRGHVDVFLYVETLCVDAAASHRTNRRPGRCCACTLHALRNQQKERATLTDANRGAASSGAAVKGGGGGEREGDGEVRSERKGKKNGATQREIPGHCARVTQVDTRTHSLRTERECGGASGGSGCERHRDGQRNSGRLARR